MLFTRIVSCSYKVFYFGAASEQKILLSPNFAINLFIAT